MKVNAEPDRQTYLWSLMRRPARWVVDAGPACRAECKTLPKALAVADALQQHGISAPDISAPDLTIDLSPHECAALWLRLQLLTA